MAAISIMNTEDSASSPTPDDGESASPENVASAEIETTNHPETGKADCLESPPQPIAEVDDEGLFQHSGATAINEEGIDAENTEGMNTEREEEHFIRMAMEASLHCAKQAEQSPDANDRLDEDHEPSSSTFLNDEISSTIGEEPSQQPSGGSFDGTKTGGSRTENDGNSIDNNSDDAPGIPQLGAFFAAERKKSSREKQTSSDGSFSLNDATSLGGDDRFNNSMGSALTEALTLSEDAPTGGTSRQRQGPSDTMSLPDDGSRNRLPRRISRVRSDVSDTLSLPDNAPNSSPSLCDYTPRGTRLRVARPVLLDTDSLPGDASLRDYSPRGTPSQRARTADYSDDRSVRSSGSYYNDDSQRSRRRGMQQQYNSTRSLQDQRSNLRRMTSLRDVNSRSTSDSASVSSESRRRDMNSHKSDSSSSLRSGGGVRSLPARTNIRDIEYSRRALREIERTEVVIDSPHTDAERRRRRLNPNLERSEAIVDSPHTSAEERRRRMSKSGPTRLPLPYANQGSPRSLHQTPSHHGPANSSLPTQSPGTTSIQSEANFSRSDLLESARAHLSAQELMEIEKALREADELETQGNSQQFDYDRGGEGYFHGRPDTLVPATPSTRSRSPVVSTPVSSSSHGLPLSQSSQSSRILPIRVPRPPSSSGRPPVVTSTPIRQISPKSQSTPTSPHSTGNSPHPSPPSIMFPPYSHSSGSPVPTKPTLSTSSSSSKLENDFAITPASPAQHIRRRTVDEEEEESNHLSLEEAQAIELALKEADQKAEEESLLLAFQMQQEELQRTLLEQQQQQASQPIPSAEPVSRSPVGRHHILSAEAAHHSPVRRQNVVNARTMSGRSDYENNQHRFHASLRVEDLDDGNERTGRHEHSSKSYDDEFEQSIGAFQSSHPAPRHPLEAQIGAFQSSEPARRHPLEEDESTISTLTHTYMGDSGSSLPSAAQTSPRSRRRGAGFVASLSRAIPGMRRRGSEGNRRQGVLGSRGRKGKHSSEQSQGQQQQHDNEESINSLQEDELTPATRSPSSGGRQRIWNRRDRNNAASNYNESRTKQESAMQGHASFSGAHQFATESDDRVVQAHIGHQSFSSFRQMKMESSGGAAGYGTSRSTPESDSTKGKAMDPHVRLQISRAINGGLIQRCNGAVKQGKEAVIYHAVKGSNGGSGGFDVAVKVFKRNHDSRGRGDYVDGDPRFAGRPYHAAPSREQVDMWCEKEFRNLLRANRAMVPVPPPLHYKENVIFMRFMGNNGWPAPQLREIDARKGHQLWDTLYTQVMESVRR